MQINLIALGTRMPNWVDTGFTEYAKRLPAECRLNLIEIDLPKRHKNAPIEKLKQQEATMLLAAIPRNNLIIALDAQGQQLTTEGLAQQLQQWQSMGHDISLLIGGPDGLHPSCLQRAQFTWSLSKLTLPHPLVRIIIAEQIYRAWSILCHHPYHR